MPLDKAEIISAASIPMSPTDRNRKKEIEASLVVALDELAMRMRSAAFISSYTVTFAASGRSKNLTGENNDLRSIFALKLGSGSTQRVLEYVDPQVFLRDHDSPDASAGTPNLYTVLVASEGYPTIKVDRPLEGAETLTVYYHVEVTPDNAGFSQYTAALVAGTQAWFYGIASDAGFMYYQRFKELTILSRAADSFLPNAPIEFRLSKEYRNIRSVVNNIRGSRG